MNKKILMLTIMLLAMLTLTIIPVQAAPKEKQDFELQYWGPMTEEFGGKSHGGPSGTEGLDYPIQRTFHGRDVTHGVFVATITIDGEPYYFVFEGEDNDFDIEVTGSFEFNHNTRRKGDTATGTFRNKETITFDGIEGTIELLVVNKIVFTFDGDVIIGMTSEGSIVGHGTGALKGVKIVGTTSGEPFVEGWSRVGTIMGWPY